MSDTTTEKTMTKKAVKGGEFLITETAADDIFIPEDWNEEQLMMADTCTSFLEANVNNNLQYLLL